MCATTIWQKGLWFCAEAISLLKYEGRKSFVVFGRSKKRKLPRRHYCCKVTRDYLLKDGLVWVQVFPRIRRKWIRRYLILSEERLSYFKERPDDGTTILDWKVIRISDVVSVKIPSDNHFIFENWNSRTLYLKVGKKRSEAKVLLRWSTEEERNIWMAALLKAKSVRLMKERSLSTVKATRIKV